MPDVRDLYTDPIDFKALALRDADFANVLKGEDNHLDFTDAAAVKQLTISLLKRDFDLRVDLPDDRLCPPVPNRFNYILWMQDLIDSTGNSLSEKFEPKREVTGMDIGTGSSCIYPLLGCRTRQCWRFIATDVDQKNLNYAEANVHRNGLKDRIMIYKSSPSETLIPLDALHIRQIDFVMTNPPFYESKASMIESAAAKSRLPFSACTGAEIEMVVPGGEVAFVKRIIEDSLRLRERVQWYSAMLGKLESVRELLEILTKQGLSEIGEDQQGTANWAVKEFVQGTKTRRWALAWSWSLRRPTIDVARGTKALGKQFLPFPSSFSIEVPEPTTTEMVVHKIDQLMIGLDLRWNFRINMSAGVAVIEKNVWSRASRRRKVQEMDVDEPTRNSEDEDEDENDQKIALVVKITIKMSEKPHVPVTVDIRWLIGRDIVLFESFCGMVKRELTMRM